MLNRQCQPPESLFRPLVLFVIEKADSPASRSAYPLMSLFVFVISYSPSISSVVRPVISAMSVTAKPLAFMRRADSTACL